ncbi:MAG: cellulose synthase complex periplasmic endoglucanase BcsZ [Methylococcales bacterium]|nr:cellulose synthase complex periplasmic endoglucanase BcsZ [Methylococcales bacterium]
MKIIVFIFFNIISINAQANKSWPEWETFKSIYISDAGRVIDGSNSQLITTSEGQSYALFFALIADDKQTFSKLLKWTENNLSKGDITINLPAWSWGLSNQTKEFGVLDSNSAADSDLWLAYVLSEAGRIWDNHYYSSLGFLIANQILQREAVQVPNYGWMILPGPKGFITNEKSWRFNPSYFPIQILRRFSELYPQSNWQEITNKSIDFIMQSSPLGLAPEWATLNAEGKIVREVAERNVGGYNAIRVYLWLGMLNNEDIQKQELMRHFSPFMDIIVKDGTVSEYFDTKIGKQIGSQPIGFSASVLPFLYSSNNINLATQFAGKIINNNSKQPDHYYDSVLSLFGKGWYEGLYEFNNNGQLIIK